MADNVSLGTFGAAPSVNNPSLGVNTGGFLDQATSFGGQFLSQLNQTASIVSKPWDKSNSNVVSPFFSYINPIDATRWNQLFPYRLLVVDVNNSNKIVNGGSSLGN